MTQKELSNLLHDTGCPVNEGITVDLKKYFRELITGKSYGIMSEHPEEDMQTKLQDR